MGVPAAVARVRRSSALDASFGIQGKRTLQLPGSIFDNQIIAGIALLGSQIVAAGLLEVDDGGFDTFVVRLKDDLVFGTGFE